MGAINWYLTKRREVLLEQAKNSPNIDPRMPVSDILESGLEILLHQTGNHTEEKRNLYPDIENESAWIEFYKKPMTKRQYKELDTILLWIMNQHNKKWERNDFLET